MTIRYAAKEDLEQLEQIEAACFAEKWPKAILSESLERRWNLFLAAEEEGKLMGYGAACIIAGEGEIQRIAILHEFRHQGRGRKLLDELVKASKARGARAMTLEVRKSNLSARRLYLAAGFQEEARRKDYYHSPKEDAIIMWNRKI